MLLQLAGELKKHIPEGPALFGTDVMSDKPQRFFAAEIIREQIFGSFSQEASGGLVKRLCSLAAKLVAVTADAGRIFDLLTGVSGCVWFAYVVSANAFPAWLYEAVAVYIVLLHPYSRPRCMPAVYKLSTKDRHWQVPLHRLRVKVQLKMSPSHPSPPLRWRMNPNHGTA